MEALRARLIRGFELERPGLWCTLVARNALWGEDNEEERGEDRKQRLSDNNGTVRALRQASRCSARIVAGRSGGELDCAGAAVAERSCRDILPPVVDDGGGVPAQLSSLRCAASISAPNAVPTEPAGICGRPSPAGISCCCC